MIKFTETVEEKDNNVVTELTDLITKYYHKHFFNFHNSTILENSTYLEIRRTENTFRDFTTEYPEGVRRIIVFITKEIAVFKIESYNNVVQTIMGDPNTFCDEYTVKLAEMDNEKYDEISEKMLEDELNDPRPDMF